MLDIDWETERQWYDAALGRTVPFRSDSTHSSFNLTRKCLTFTLQAIPLI